MTPEQFRELRSSFDNALELDAVERAKFLGLMRLNSPEVAEELERMLSAHQTDDGFLEVPSSRRNDEGSEDSTLLRSGEVIVSRYEIQEKVGEGGFGHVYLAKDLRLDQRRVVLKTFKLTETPWLAKRFQEEVRALARLDHQGIVGVIDSGKLESGGNFLVMQFVPGRTLQQLINEGPLDPRRALRFICQLCEALTVAHEAGILHRDLKPENILIREEGQAEERAVLIDFGIARTDLLDPAGHGSTVISGTPAYMPAEQLMGRTGPASDIFSLGLTAVAMLAGRTPARPVVDYDLRPSVRDMLQNLELPGDAKRAIVKSVSPNESDRFALARELGSACQLASPKKSSNPIRATSIAVAVLVAVLAAAVWWNLKSVAAPRQTIVAAVERRGGPSQDGALHKGDGVAVTLRPPSSGYLYLFDETQGTEQFIVLFPGGTRPQAPSAGPIRIPAASDAWLELDGQSPEELLWIVWSKQPVPVLEKLQYHSRPPNYGYVPQEEIQPLRALLHATDNSASLESQLEWESDRDPFIVSVRVPVR